MATHAAGVGMIWLVFGPIYAVIRAAKILDEFADRRDPRRRAAEIRDRADRADEADRQMRVRYGL